MQLPWWQRLPSRLLDEEAALQVLREGEDPILLTHRWERADGDEPRLLAQIRVATRTLDLEVRFPAHYPDGCPSVRPVPHDTRISAHQFKNSGILCLELGPDNWHPRYTGADMIRSAWKLVLYERLNDFEPIDIPSRHVVTLAEMVTSAPGVLLRSSEFESRLRVSTDNTEFEAIWLAPHYKQVMPISFPKDSSLATPPGMTSGGHQLAARLVRLQEGAPSPSEVPDDAAKLANYVEKFGNFTLADDLSVLILTWPDGETRGYLRSKSTLLKLQDMPVETSDTTRTPSILHAPTSTLRIGVVGLGSLGSKIATSLARVGFRRFVLADGDVMRGENVGRHQGTFRDVGVMKVEVAKQVIKDVSSSEIEVKTFPVNIGAATNPEYHAKLLEELASCDVLVDATANPDVFSLLAGLASDHGRPLVWGEVFAGGLGGMVGSAHPERDPCPRCVRVGFLSVAAGWPPAPYLRPTVAYGSDEDAVLVATDADVSVLAAAATNRVLGLVIRDEAVLPSVLVIGLRRGWIFEAPMQTVPVHVRRDDSSCDRCWRSAAEPDPAASASAEALLASHADAHGPSHS